MELQLEEVRVSHAAATHTQDSELPRTQELLASTQAKTDTAQHLACARQDALDECLVVQAASLNHTGAAEVGEDFPEAVYFSQMK